MTPKSSHTTALVFHASYVFIGGHRTGSAPGPGGTARDMGLPVRGCFSPAVNSPVTTVTADVAQTLEPSRTLGTKHAHQQGHRGRVPAMDTGPSQPFLAHRTLARCLTPGHSRPGARSSGEDSPLHEARPERAGKWGLSKAACEPEQAARPTPPSRLLPAFRPRTGAPGPRHGWTVTVVHVR